MSYVHWQYQTAPGHPQSLTLDEFARIEDLREVLKVLSVEEKIKLLAVSLGLERSSWFPKIRGSLKILFYHFDQCF